MQKARNRQEFRMPYIVRLPLNESPLIRGRMVGNTEVIPKRIMGSQRPTGVQNSLRNSGFGGSSGYKAH